MARIVILELPDALASSVAITRDTLRTANILSSLKGRREPFDVHPINVSRSTTHDFRARDIVIVPGLGITSETELVTRLGSATVRRAITLLTQARTAGAILAASCASTFVLAEAGLLNRRRATTTWWLAPLFQKRYPDIELVTEQIVVADWPVATAGAAMAQMDLMLAIIAKYSTPRTAENCARYLLLDQRRSQAPYMAVTFLAGQDPHIARAERWTRQNIERAFAMEEMAAGAGLSPRTFARRLKSVCGMSPVQFAQRIRSEVAVMLLETTTLSVDEIARRVGYSEPSTLRRLLRRRSNVSPSRLRATA